MAVVFLRGLLLSVIWLTLHLVRVNSHPQCLDFNPPYQDDQVSYCSEYKDYGCCWRVTDRRARKIVDYLEEVEGNIDQCKTYLHNVSCLFCNPYAAHIYDVEGGASTRRAFPWLCQDYCLEAYRQCHSSLLRMFQLDHAEFGVRETPATPAELEEDALKFCGQVITTESPYCYPQILSGPQLPSFNPSEITGELDCICALPVASGLRNPLAATHSGDGSGRLFIAEQIGVIRVLSADNTLLSAPFLDISSRVLTSSREGDERGLLGLTFHPDYRTNGKFYVYYSTRVNSAHWSRVSEFTTQTNNPNVANSNSEREIWSVRQPASNHNGGELLFSPDGYLLIFLGDGGGSGDTYRNGLNKGTWLGSILRINVDLPDPSRGTLYSIPSDNPFLNEPGTLPEIFAYGLRNPWRCSIDRGDRDTMEGRGRIFCGDVGQGSFEEVDIIVSGGNYGWRAYEGYNCFVSSLCSDSSLGPFISPIHAYGRNVGVSVTGGYVYRGCLYPNLRGLYIFGDYGSGRLFALRQNGTSWLHSALCMGGPDTCTGRLVGQDRQRHVLSFGEDEDGELYILTTDEASPTHTGGVVYHIVDPARRESPTQCQTLRSYT